MHLAAALAAVAGLRFLPQRLDLRLDPNLTNGVHPVNGSPAGRVGLRSHLCRIACKNAGFQCGTPGDANIPVPHPDILKR